MSKEIEEIRKELEEMKVMFMKSSVDNKNKPVRKEKNRTQFSTSLSKKDIKKIDEIKSETGLTKSKILDKALKLLFDVYQNDIEKFNKL